MQNYQNHTNDYIKRGNVNYGRNYHHTCSHVSTPSSCVTSYTDSSCCQKDDVLEGMHLAMAYVPWQNWNRIYSLEKAFCRGTIFEELDKPFLGTGGCN